MMGVAGFIGLLWLMTLFDVLLFGWWRLFFLIVIALLLSVRSGRAWTMGREPDSGGTRTTHPTVAVEGKAGATYVMLEPAKAGGKAPRVKPREFSPVWWALYTVVVRAPVALGDFLLTAFWRVVSGRWEAGASAGERTVPPEHFDYPSQLSPPDRERF